MIVRIDPNWLAYLALAAWIPVALVAFARLRPAAAVMVVILGAQLLLPVGAAFTMAGLPDLDRGRIAATAALAGCLLFHRSKLRAIVEMPWVLLALVLLVLSSLATALTNTDVTSQGVVVLPALRLYDGFSVGIGRLLDFGVPMLLGISLYRSERDLRFLQRALVISALVYSPLILFELRMSPQLHNMVYGYTPHSFLQHMRGGGYRPMVFIGHGLAVSMFLSTATLAALGLWRARVPLWRGAPSWPAAAFLFVILILCQSLAPVLYTLVGGILIVVMPMRVRFRVAGVLAALTLLYPALSTFELVPTDRAIELAATISEERAESLAFRFYNEGQLLDRAQERVWFGWGGWGRNRVFDPEQGRDRTVTDGFWILTIGMSGIVGFTVLFGLVVVPIWALGLAWPQVLSRRNRTLLSSLSLILAFRAVDLLPNADLSPLVVLLAGSGLGFAVGIPVEQRARRRRARRATPAPGVEMSREGAPTIH